MPISLILIVGYARKAAVSSESKTSRAEDAEPVVDMAELGARLAERLAALGNPAPPRNAGKRRTASKKALLKAIEAAGGKW
jgi:hypothetical protein